MCRGQSEREMRSGCPVIQHRGEGLEGCRRKAVRGFEVDTHRKAEGAHAIHDPFVEIEKFSALCRRGGIGKAANEGLLRLDACIARILNLPANELPAALDLRNETKGEKDLGPMETLLRELGQKAHDTVRIQKLREREVRPLVALEFEAPKLGLAGRNQNRAAIGDLVPKDAQGVAGRHTVTLTILHRPRDANEDDSVDAYFEKFREAPAKYGLLEEGCHLRADALQPRGCGASQLPGFEGLQARLHLDGPVRVLHDHARDHQVTDPVADSGAIGTLQRLLDLLPNPRGAFFNGRRDEFQRYGVHAHTCVGPFQKSLPPRLWILADTTTLLLIVVEGRGCRDTIVTVGALGERNASI